MNEQWDVMQPFDTPIKQINGAVIFTEASELPCTAQQIVDALAQHNEQTTTFEVGPGMGVLTRFLLQREDIKLRLVEIDKESVEYLIRNYPTLEQILIEADFLKFYEGGISKNFALLKRNH